MSTIDAAGIETFLRDQYDAWNRGDHERLFALFDAAAPGGYSIEFIGGGIMDGRAALQDLWDKYADKTKTELVSVLVNGLEAATIVHNHHYSPTSYSMGLSVETYNFTGGKLHIRYFH